MQRIQSISEITIKDILLLIDEDGKIRGMDEILNIESNGNISYKAYAAGFKSISENFVPTYQGNLNKFINKYEIYKIDLNIVKAYNDKKLDNALIAWDYGTIFTETLTNNNSLSSLTWSFALKLILKDFNKRMQFIDFTNKYTYILHLLSFQESQNQVNETLKNQIVSEFTKLFSL